MLFWFGKPLEVESLLHELLCIALAPTLSDFELVLEQARVDLGIVRSQPAPIGFGYAHRLCRITAEE